MLLIAVYYRRCGRNLRAQLYIAIISLSPSHVNLKTLYTQHKDAELFVHELLDLREHSSILTNGMTLLRSEIDSLIVSVCCT